MIDGSAEFGTELILTSEAELNDFLKDATWGDPRLLALDDTARLRELSARIAHSKDPVLKPLEGFDPVSTSAELGALRDRMRQQEISMPGYGHASDGADKVFGAVVNDFKATGRHDQYVSAPLAAADLIRKKIKPIINKPLPPQS